MTNRDLRVDTDTDLNRLFTAISGDMAEAAIHWRLFERLRSLVPKYEVELNQARCFWSLTLEAHRDTALWRLGRLYDKSIGALSLPNFLQTLLVQQSRFDEASFRARLADNPFVETLANDRSLSLTELQTDLASVTVADPLVKALVEYRNKHLGHRDANVVMGKTIVPGLSQANIHDLLDRARTIVNHYSLLYRASSQSTRMVGEDDCDSVLEAVRFQLRAHEAQLARELDNDRAPPPA